MRSNFNQQNNNNNPCNIEEVVNVNPNSYCNPYMEDPSLTKMMKIGQECSNDSNSGYRVKKIQNWNEMKPKPLLIDDYNKSTMIENKHGRKPMIHHDEAFISFETPCATESIKNKQNNSRLPPALSIQREPMKQDVAQSRGQYASGNHTSYEKINNNSMNSRELNAQDKTLAKVRNVEENSINLDTQKYPIYSYKEAIIEAVERNQIVIISGNTGCGKSTQVPKYLHDHYRRNRKVCRILCTQPRRIAAINLAKRVREELKALYGNEAYDGKMVGFQIGMESDFNQNTDILYVTNGIFLQRFIHEDTFDQESIMQKFTHVILDEIHERDIDSDFIMLAIKHVLSKNKSFRLILMSATIKAEMFAKYFSKEEIDRCSSFEFNYDDNKKKKYEDWSTRNIGFTLWQNDQKVEDYNNNGGVSSFNTGKRDIKPNAPQMTTNVNKANNVNTANPTNSTITNNTMNSKNNQDDPWGNLNARNNNANDANSKNLHYNQASQNKYLRDNEGRNETPAIIINIDDNTKSSKDMAKYIVTDYYLDDLQNFFDIKIEISKSEFSKRRAFLYLECITATINLIQYIISPKNLEEKKYRFILGDSPSILIFLPGISEIYLAMDKIYEYFRDNHMLDLIPLHSTLSDTNQEDIFKKPQAGHRKIILSTNIAESSITIPDVLYVIDFCLTKELNAIGKRTIESLDLVWASKASCRQRAGRTGRVSNGFVFRLVPKEFYIFQMDDFSKPEMHRSPLDKLILRIKMLHESEKANKSKQPNEYFFKDPKLVLGRALEPPDIDQIGQSIKSLKNCGALTMSKDPNEFGDITFLGKVYCDLPCEVKISKLCLLGVAYEIPEEAFTLAAVLSQQKLIFLPETKTRSRDKFHFFKQLWENSDGQNSDHIAVLKIYIQWENLWGKYLTRHRNKKVKSAASFEEREWCTSRILDYQVLRDIYCMKEDIRSRLQKLGVKIGSCISEVIENDDKMQNYKILVNDLKTRKDYYDRIKIVLAGAFYPHYLKKGSWHSDMTLKLADNMKKSLMLDPLRTITLRVPINNDHSEDQYLDKWKSLFNKFGKVEKITLLQDKLYVSFTEDDYEFAIRCLNYVKTDPFDNNRYLHVKGKDVGTITEEIKFIFEKKNTKLENIQSLLTSQEFQILSECGELEYLRKCKFFDFISNKEIRMEWDSINCLFIDKLDSNPYTMVSHEYQERKSGRIYAKYTTFLDLDNPYLAHIISLLFAPDVQLKPDVTQSRYEGAFIEHCEISFNFYLTSTHIGDINEVRSQIAHFFKKENMMKGTNSALWNNTEKLLTKKLIKYTPEEKWQILFIKENQSIPGLYIPQLRSGNKHKKSRLMQSSEDNRIELKSFFLNVIDVPKLPNEPDFDDEDAIKYHTEMANMYKIWKEAMIAQLENTTKMIEMTKTFLICGQCEMKICEYTKIHQEIFSDTLRVLDANSFLLKKIEPNLNDEFYCNPNVKWLKQTELKYGIPKDIEFWGCFHNHIFCIKAYEYDLSSLKQEERENFLRVKLEYSSIRNLQLQETYYITSYSNLKLLYPDLSIQQFNFDDYDYKTMVKRSEEKLREREKRLKILRCAPCEKNNFANIDEFQKHIKDKNHKHNLQEFKSSLINEDPGDKSFI